MRKVSNTEIALYVELVVTVLFSILSLIERFTKGTPIPWSTMCIMFCILTCGFTAVEKKKEKEA